MHARITLRRVALAAALLVPALSFADPDAITEGSMRTVTADGRRVALPLEHTAVEAEVSGFVSRVQVVQTFQNPFAERIEALYVFPLPDKGAVDGMTMRIGQRTVRGEIKRREEARQLYEAAKNQGRTAALLDQERPNIFTQAVANILPGEKIQITLTYVAPLAYDAGEYTFNFPMVVGPRYIPANGSVSAAEAKRISPPLLPEGLRSGHDVSLTLKLDAGVEIREMRSPSHDVEIIRQGMRAAEVRIKPHDTLPNKDFILRYAVAGERLQAAVLTHRNESEGFFTLMLQPQADFRAQEITPKEMFFVIDQSCSQSGLPMAKQKAIIHQALERMNANDTFNVITFHSGVGFFSPKSLPNNRENVARAKAFVDGLQTNGGTEMLLGIGAALNHPRDPERLRMVLFLTDGYVGNDLQVIDAVQKQIGHSRMFLYGVGSSVNHFLLERMAEVGRGYYQYSPPTEDTQKSVERFYDRIAKPYLVDLELDFGSMGVEEVYPRQLKDLYAAQPIIVTGRFKGGGRGAFTLKGRIANRPYTERIEVELPRATQVANSALASMFGRAKIEHLSAQQYGGEKPELIEAITKTALAYKLMSPYTSFVAVDEAVRTGEGAPAQVVQPVLAPEGTVHGAFAQPQGQAVGTGSSSLGGLGGGGARASAAPRSPPAPPAFVRPSPRSAPAAEAEPAPIASATPSERPTRRKAAIDFGDDSVKGELSKPEEKQDKAKRALPRIAQVVVKGPAAKADVEALVRRAMSSVRKQLEADGFRGEVTLQLELGADGKVTNVALVHGGAGSAALVKTLVSALQTQRLDAQGSASTVVLRLVVE